MAHLYPAILTLFLANPRFILSIVRYNLGIARKKVCIYQICAFMYIYIWRIISIKWSQGYQPTVPSLWNMWPTDGWKANKKTSRTQTSTITRWLERAISTGALFIPSTTYRPKRRSSSQRKSPCFLGMRLSIKFLPDWICKCGMRIISLQTTSWVCCCVLLCKVILDSGSVLMAFIHTVTCVFAFCFRCNRTWPESISSRCKDSEAVLHWHGHKWARYAHGQPLQTEEN